MTERLTTFTCRICNKPIPLEDCESRDAPCYPVHKDCYAKLMLEEKKKRKVGSR